MPHASGCFLRMTWLLMLRHKKKNNAVAISFNKEGNL